MRGARASGGVGPVPGQVEGVRSGEAPQEGAALLSRTSFHRQAGKGTGAGPTTPPAPTRAGGTRRSPTPSTRREETTGTLTSTSRARTPKTTRLLALIGASARRARPALAPCRPTLPQIVGGRPTTLRRGPGGITGRPCVTALALATRPGGGVAPRRLGGETTARRQRLGVLLIVTSIGIVDQISSGAVPLRRQNTRPRHAQCIGATAKWAGGASGGAR